MKSPAQVKRLARAWLQGVYCPNTEEPMVNRTETDLRSDLLDVLSEAAVEIANLDGPSNIVVRRLRDMAERVEADEPVKVRIAGAE